jgi:mxaJ protein
MSSGSKHTIVSAAIFAVSIGLTVSAYYSHRPRVVHLSVAAPMAVEAAGPDAGTLRVCADPNNLPFSNERGEGFENQVAVAIAHDLHKSLAYYWHPQRRGFLRATLLADRCDVVMGVPATLEMARVTRPYYRSSYVFVSRRDRRLSLTSFDDPRLRSLRIAIPITGDDYDNPPPARALAVRHILDNVHGYPVYGDYSKPHPSSGAVDAVRRGEVDVAIAWGPIAGFAARQPGTPLNLSPVPARDGSSPFTFDIAMAVRTADTALAAALDQILKDRAHEIERILTAYGVPLTNRDGRIGR